MSHVSHRSAFKSHSSCEVFSPRGVTFKSPCFFHFIQVFLLALTHHVVVRWLRFELDATWILGLSHAH